MKNTNSFCFQLCEFAVLDDLTLVANTLDLPIDELHSRRAARKRQKKLGEEQFSLVTVDRAIDLKENLLNYLNRFTKIISASSEFDTRSWIHRFQLKSTKSHIKRVRSLVKRIVVRPRQQVLDSEY